ncbi:MAG: hypothetical protein IJ406_02080 [Oscillospiraceae bacterium]|nr:hypothetical protein [Oscillospiraceae bacterium]
MSPYEGDSSCGSNAGVGKNFSFRYNPVSFGFPKEMGVYSYKNFNGTVFTIPPSFPAEMQPPFNKGGYLVPLIRLFQPKTAEKSTFPRGKAVNCYKIVTFVIKFQYFCKKAVDNWFLLWYIMVVINVTNWLKSL